MKKISRLFLFGSMILLLLAAACAPEEGTVTPGPDETLIAGLTSSPAATDSTVTAGTATASTPVTTETPTVVATQPTTTTDTTLTPSIPVTGDVILLACQFCVDTMAHALLVMPETTTFDVIEFSPTISDTDSGCNTVDTFNGRQVVLCRAPENTSFTMNLCANGGTDCTELVVDLQSCPVTTSQTGVPTETETLQPGAVTNTPGVGVTSTSSPSTLPSITPTP